MQHVQQNHNTLVAERSKYLKILHKIVRRKISLKVDRIFWIQVSRVQVSRVQASRVQASRVQASRHRECKRPESKRLGTKSPSVQWLRVQVPRVQTSSRPESKRPVCKSPGVRSPSVPSITLLFYFTKKIESAKSLLRTSVLHFYVVFFLRRF